jgi:hypothetical protein
MMKLTGCLLLGVMLLAPLASAHEYPLQFTPNAGYRSLIVAGYYFDSNNDVIGTCSYYTVKSARGGKQQATQYSQTCKWDNHGNLLSVAKGTPETPDPVYTKGSLVVFAENGGEYTGTDAKLPEHGFVNTPGSHYTWVTSTNAAVLHDFVYTFAVTLRSDGDGPVDITSLNPHAALGKVTLKSSTCEGEIKVGSTCVIGVTYDPTGITSATGAVADTFRIAVVSDAGEPVDYIQKLTILVPKK